jgi:hypothetical protein
MKVRIIQRPGYGDRNGVFHKHGDVVDFPDVLAIKLIRHQIAVPAPEKTKETAILEAEEMAADVKRPRGRPKKGPITTKAFSPGDE